MTNSKINLLAIYIFFVYSDTCKCFLQDMTYDLGDGATWEPYFPNVDKPLLVLPGEDPSVIAEDSDEKMVRWNCT